NYQRFTRTVRGHEIPYLVAGAGGYHNLHHIGQPTLDQLGNLPAAIPGHPNVRFDAYCDDRHGFLRLDVSTTHLRGESVAVKASRAPVAPNPLHPFPLDIASHNLTACPPPPPHRVPPRPPPVRTARAREPRIPPAPPPPPPPLRFPRVPPG